MGDTAKEYTEIASGFRETTKGRRMDQPVAILLSRKRSRYESLASGSLHPDNSKWNRNAAMLVVKHIDGTSRAGVESSFATNFSARLRSPEDCRVQYSAEKVARICRHFDAAAMPGMETGVPVA